MNGRRGSRGRGQQGFSLLELVIALVIFAILATIMVTAMGSSMVQSSQPIFSLQRIMALHQVMENIRADFSAQNDLALLKTAIGTDQQNNSYGAYEVVDNRYIKFIGHNEAAGVAADGILKVSIRGQGGGLTLTELFVEW